MMDRKTIWIMVGCLIALIAWQKIVDILYPPTPKKPKPPVAATTNMPPTQAAASATNVAATVAETPVEPEGPRPPEQIVVLSNEFVRVEFTSYGGGIRSVELLKYRSNGAGNVVLNKEASAPALAVTGWPGADTNGVFEVLTSDSKTVIMRGRMKTDAAITKRFSLGDRYVLTGHVEYTPSKPTPLAFGTPTMNLVVGTASPARAKETPDFLGIDWLAAGKYQNRNPKQVAKVAPKEPLRVPAEAQWAAVKNQFFTMIVTPATNAQAVSFAQTNLPPPKDWKSSEPPHGLSATIELPPTRALETGLEYDFAYYAGPKEYERLVALGKGQEEVMQFGMWGAISVVLLKGMKFLYGVIPNYGVAIIIITILIKLLFWPIQAKSIKSMKQMQKFQPMMTKLREKYKDDAQRLNAEMMKLYKEHKINPFAGCLPMLVQIPVFFGLFAMLRSAIELRGAHFLWVKDLSQPDTIFAPFGLPINPLPLFMVGSMIWQQKITPTTADPQQAKMMQFMPLMMLVFFYNASSGLALYWTVQQLLSIGQQWWSLRQAEPGTAPGAPMPAGKTK